MIEVILSGGRHKSSGFACRCAGTHGLRKERKIASV